MSTETQERAGRESTGLPSGVRKRQSWRPPAVRAFETLVSGLMRRAEPFVSNAAERLAWHEQFIQRVLPWQGWLPVSLEFPTKEQTSEGQIREMPAISMVSRRNGSDATNETSPPPVQRYAAPAAPTPGLTTPQQQGAKPAPSRPAIRLAILRTIQTTKVISGMDAGSRNGSPPITRDHNSWRWLSIADVSKSEPRLVTGVSSTPRQEVSGGFQVHQPSHPVLPEARRTRTEPETSPLMQWAKNREASLVTGPAILQTIQTTQTKSGMDTGSHSESPQVTRDHSSWHWLSIADVSKSEPHLVTGAPSTSHQEMRSGFSIHQPSQSVLPEAERTGAEPETSPLMRWTKTREASLAIGPAILRTIETTQTKSGMDAGSRNGSPPVTRDHSSWHWLSIADVSKSEPRLVTGASSAPRQEVSGGFQVHQPPHSVLPEARRTRTEPETSPLLQWAKTREASTASPSKSESQGAIETLLEQTVMPVPLPGLELRLVSPSEEDSPTHALQHVADADNRQPAADDSTPPVPVPASPPRPELDINEVAEKVYNTLVRRQQLERERMGLY